MAAPSSPALSCEILDLAVASTLDDASSRFFFRKGGGGDLSWPVAAAIESTLTNEKSLLALCDKYGVPRELRPVCAGSLGCAAACDTPKGEGRNALCIYSDALEAGLRFPMPTFYQKLLRHYDLAPSQLAPNAWRYMAAFLHRCKDAGVEEPLVSAFTYFFSLFAQREKDKPLGWYHFHPCTGRPRLFSGSVPTKNGWRTRFLFLQPPEGMSWKCPVAWGKPRREAVGVVELTDAAIKKLEDMPCVDLRDFLGCHESPVGALELLRLHSPTAPPKVEPEPAGASSAQGVDSTRRKGKYPAPDAGSHPAAVTPPGAPLLQLHSPMTVKPVPAGASSTPVLALPSAASGKGGDSTRRKRKCPALDAASHPAAVTPSGAPPLQLQLHSPMAPPTMKPVLAGASSTQALALTSAASGEGGDPTRWKCKCPAVDAGSHPATVTPSAVPPLQLQRMEITPSLDGASGSSETPLLPGQHPGCMYEAKVRVQDEQHYSQTQITELQGRLQYYEASNRILVDFLVNERTENTRLREKHDAKAAELNQARNENTRLREMHDTKAAELNQARNENTRLREKHDAKVAELNQAHEAAAEKLKAELAETVRDVKKGIAHILYPDLDASFM